MIPFYYGSGAGCVTGTVINYGSVSVKAKSFGSGSSFGSDSATLLEVMSLLINPGTTFLRHEHLHLVLGLYPFYLLLEPL